MAYEPTVWVNGETPINETNLNKMEEGIMNAHNIAAEHTEVIGDHEGRISGLESLPSGGASMDLLWENPKPSDAFSAKTITVPDMSAYTFIMYLYKYRATNAPLLSQIVLHGQNAMLSFAAKSSYGRRLVEHVDETTLSFETASNNGEDSDAFSVPYQIYGIKTVVKNLVV